MKSHCNRFSTRPGPTDLFDNNAPIFLLTFYTIQYNTIPYNTIQYQCSVTNFYGTHIFRWCRSLLGLWDIRSTRKARVLYRKVEGLVVGATPTPKAKWVTGNQRIMDTLESIQTELLHWVWVWLQCNLLTILTSMLCWERSGLLEQQTGHLDFQDQYLTVPKTWPV